jgi:hypothetical protein
MVIAVNSHSYLIEAQISNDPSMAVRVFRYIMNEGRDRQAAKDDHVITIKLPQVRVIYWEDTAATPDREYIDFIFPKGEERRYEIESLKFSGYGVRELEEAGLGLLLPFCVIGKRRAAGKAKGREERKKLAGEVQAVVEEVVKAGERMLGRGELRRGDLENILRLTKVLWEEVYRAYTEFEVEEGRMWENIKVIDYEAITRERDEAVRQRDEATRKWDEATRKWDEAAWQRDMAARQRDEATRKLLALGVSREELAREGLIQLTNSPSD